MATQNQYVSIPGVVVRYTDILPKMYFEKGLDDNVWRAIKAANDKSFTRATSRTLTRDCITCICLGCLCHTCNFDKFYREELTQELNGINGSMFQGNPVLAFFGRGDISVNVALMRQIQFGAAPGQQDSTQPAPVVAEVINDRGSAEYLMKPVDAAVVTPSAPPSAEVQSVSVLEF